MRFAIATALPVLLLLAPLAATAQHWNEAGPGRDLLSSTVTDFDAFRQRTANQPAAPGLAPLPQAQQRAPIPILDWVPPPAQPPRAQRSASPPRRRPASTPREPAPMRDPAPVAAPVRSGNGGQDWERTFAERERELDRLRRILEDDRARYERSRQPQLQ